MEWHGYGSTQINKASPHLCVPGSRCNVIAIAVALAASWAISWEPLTFWGNLWGESKFHDILQWMNKHQCLRSSVLSILFCVCFFACLWICFVWCDIAACMFLSLRRIKLDTEHLKNPREWKREISSKPLLNNPTAVATFLLASSCSHHDVDAIFGTMAVVSTPGGASSSTTGSLHVQGAILDV